MIILTDIQKTFELYNFDYIEINPKNANHLKWEIVPEEMFTDFNGPYNYYGKIKISDKLIEVYWNEDVLTNHFIFKYKNIKKERKIKFNSLIDSNDTIN
jgi:hypothetical protein